MKKTIVTFTGVDRFTDLNRLEELQHRFPLAEFGVLVSGSRSGNENRYPGRDFFPELCGRGLNLALHVCGSLSRNALRTDFREVVDFLRMPPFYEFRRIQLNGLTAGIDIFTPIRTAAPGRIEEVIIQQNPSLRPFSKESIHVSGADISFLCDASGGMGIETRFLPFVIYKQEYLNSRVGYAGGINPDNVIDKWQEAKAASMHDGLWIDMESGVRTNDRFDLDKVETVLKKMFPLL